MGSGAEQQLARLRFEGLGARERGKVERRARIKRAAREIFERAGYEGTTMRAIAKRARVGVGTLFRHAADKSDLFLMILNDDLDAITDTALGAVEADGELIEQLLTIFRPRYAYYETATDPALYALLEAHFTKPSDQTERYARRRGRLLGAITEIVARQQQLDRIRRDRDPAAIARFFMVLYLAEARLWLRESELDAQSGIEQLAQTFRLALEGLAASCT